MSVDKAIVALSETRREATSKGLTSALAVESESHRVSCAAVTPARQTRMGENADAPRFTPVITRLIAPVPAPLALAKWLSLIASTENISVCVDRRCPAVANAGREDKSTPWPTRHRSDVSPSHQVDWQTLCRMIAFIEWADIPIRDPRTVTLADPEGARFKTRATEINNPSTDTPEETVPATFPTETCKREHANDELETKHREDESDAHVVASQEEAADRDPAEFANLPMLAPCTVTRPDPVDPPLPLVTELIWLLSADKASEKLPRPTPAVAIALMLNFSVCPARQRIDVSESHADTWQPVPDSLAAPDATNDLRPAPCSDKLTEPEATAFLTTTVLLPLLSPEYPVLILPSRSPTVIDNLRDRTEPTATLASKHVSETHMEDSHPVCDTLPRLLIPDARMFAPSTLRDQEPVPAALPPAITLIAALSTECMWLVLPTRPPRVAMLREVLPDAVADKHRTPVSDIHAVASQPEPAPTLPDPDTPDTPMPPP